MPVDCNTKNKTQLLDMLKAHDDQNGTPYPASPDEIEVPDNKFNDIRIGLHADDTPESRSALEAVKHDFVLPVEYINSWFLGSTWNDIAREGKVAGRPNHNATVILKH